MAKKESISIANERINRLHSLALQRRYSYPEYSRRYITLMENVAKRVDLTLPKQIKRSYCKKCKTPYDRYTRIRTKNGKVVLVTCTQCGDRRHLSFSSENDRKYRS